MRVLFLTVYFPPEVGAPQARTLETAKRFVEWGHEVTVITAFPNHPTGVVREGYRGKLLMRERMDGVEVLRTWAYPAPNRGLWRWAAKHFSFAVSALARSPAADRPDVIVVGSSALFAGLAASVISRVRGVPWVLMVTDLWPQTAVAQGQLSGGRLVGLTKKLASFVYSQADAIVGVTAGICESLVQLGVPAGKIHHIPNGTDTELFSPSVDGAGLRHELGLEGAFVVMYAGTMGLAQGLGVVLDAAKLLAAETDLRFVLAGDGVERRALEDRARTEGIDNVVFLKQRAHNEIPALLNTADIVLVTLRGQELFQGALPSKTSEALACGRPVVMTIAGEAAELLAKTGAGLAVEPESPTALADAIGMLRASPEMREEMGHRGREYAVEHLDRTKLAKRLEQVLLDVVESHGRGKNEQSLGTAVSSQE